MTKPLKSRVRVCVGRVRFRAVYKRTLTRLDDLDVLFQRYPNAILYIAKMTSAVAYITRRLANNWGVLKPQNNQVLVFYATFVLAKM